LIFGGYNIWYLLLGFYGVNFHLNISYFEAYISPLWVKGIVVIISQEDVK